MGSRNLDKFLLDRIVIYRDNPVEDKWGGATATERTKEDFDIPARIYGISGRKIVDTQGKTFAPTKRIIVPLGTDLRIGDTISRQADLQEFVIVSLDTKRDGCEAQFIQADMVEQNGQRPI